jgi:dGTP triphosphohydrolase
MKKYFFSPSAHAFYLDTLHKVIPADAMEISAVRYAELIGGQSSGLVIALGEDGLPALHTPTFSIGQLQSSAFARTRQLANTIRERVAKAHHHLQSARWSVQLAAAQDVIVNGVAATAFSKDQLDVEARLRARGETREQLAAKVVANSSVFTLVGAVVDGIETATLDAIAAYEGTDPQALEALVQQARMTAMAEVYAIYEPVIGQAQAQATVDGIFEA